MSADTNTNIITTADAPVGDQPPDAARGQAADGPQPESGPWIKVSLLTAHPGNVRADLELSPEFCASVAEFGVRVPLLITPDGPSYRVIDGTAGWLRPSRQAWM
jgi:hypothetical protein